MDVEYPLVILRDIDGWKMGRYGHAMKCMVSSNYNSNLRSLRLEHDSLKNVSPFSHSLPVLFGDDIHGASVKKVISHRFCVS